MTVERDDYMNVAIMGAGLSGLSCTIMLERFGIHPYESEHYRSIDISEYKSDLQQSSSCKKNSRTQKKPHIVAFFVFLLL